MAAFSMHILASGIQLAIKIFIFFFKFLNVIPDSTFSLFSIFPRLSVTSNPPLAESGQSDICLRPCESSIFHMVVLPNGVKEECAWARMKTKRATQKSDYFEPSYSLQDPAIKVDITEIRRLTPPKKKILVLHA